jgi:hypothetical protein
MSLSGALAAIYFAGVALGLIVMRDRWPSRVVTAVAWPLGVLSFVVVAAILSVAAVYLWPVPILATLVLLTAAVWLAL